MKKTHTRIQAYIHIRTGSVSGVGDMITHFSIDTKLPSYFLIYLNNECWVFNAVQLSSVTQLCLTLCSPMNYSTPGLLSNTISQSLPKLRSIESVMRSNHLTLGCPLLVLLSIFPSIRVFSNESVLIRWPNIGVSTSTSVLPMHTQDWPPLGWTGWISLQSKGLSRVFSNTTVQKHQFFGAQLSL